MHTELHTFLQREAHFVLGFEGFGVQDVATAATAGGSLVEFVEFVQIVRCIHSEGVQFANGVTTCCEFPSCDAVSGMGGVEQQDGASGGV